MRMEKITQWWASWFVHFSR